MTVELTVAIYSGVLALVGVVVGSAVGFISSWAVIKAQEKQQKRQIQATAVEAEVVAFREAVISALEQVLVIQETKTAGSKEALVKELFKLDRKVHRMTLFGSVELLKASGKLQAAVAEFSGNGVISGVQDPRYITLHKVKTVWLTRARKEIIELRLLTLEHSSLVEESTQELESQLEKLIQHSGSTIGSSRPTLPPAGPKT